MRLLLLLLVVVLFIIYTFQMLLSSIVIKRPTDILQFKEGQPPSAYLHANWSDTTRSLIRCRPSKVRAGEESPTASTTTSSKQTAARVALARNFRARLARSLHSEGKRMTAKNRQKNSEKGAASGQQDDAHKKNQPSASVSPTAHHGGDSSSSSNSGSTSRCGSCLGLIASTVFYATLLGAAGFAAFRVQHAVEEMRESHAKQEESARQYSDIATKMVSVVQQVSVGECGRLRRGVDGARVATSFVSFFEKSHNGCTQ